MLSTAVSGSNRWTTLRSRLKSVSKGNALETTVEEIPAEAKTTGESCWATMPENVQQDDHGATLMTNAVQLSKHGGLVKKVGWVENPIGGAAAGGGAKIHPTAANTSSSLLDSSVAMASTDPQRTEWVAEEDKLGTAAANIRDGNPALTVRATVGQRGSVVAAGKAKVVKGRKKNTGSNESKALKEPKKGAQASTPDGGKWTRKEDETLQEAVQRFPKMGNGSNDQTARWAKIAAYLSQHGVSGRKRAGQQERGKRECKLRYKFLGGHLASVYPDSQEKSEISAHLERSLEKSPETATEELEIDDQHVDSRDVFLSPAAHTRTNQKVRVAHHRVGDPNPNTGRPTELRAPRTRTRTCRGGAGGGENNDEGEAMRTMRAAPTFEHLAKLDVFRTVIVRYLDIGSATLTGCASRRSLAGVAAHLLNAIAIEDEGKYKD